MKHSRITAGLLGAFALAGAIVFWRALDRAESPVPESSAESEFTPDIRATSEARHEEMPTEDMAAQIAEDVAHRAVELTESLPSRYRLSPSRRAGFESVVREQIELSLLPDFDRWMARVERYGGDPWDGGSPPAGHPGEEFRQHWEKNAQALRLAPLSIRDMEVRVQRFNGAWIEQPRLASGHIYPLIRGHYSDRVTRARSTRGHYTDRGEGPPYDDIYEVLVPMRRSQESRSGGRSRVSALLGFWVAWDESERRWRPYDLVLHQQDGSFGGFVF